MIFLVKAGGMYKIDLLVALSNCASEARKRQAMCQPVSNYTLIKSWVAHTIYQPAYAIDGKAIANYVPQTNP